MGKSIGILSLKGGVGKTSTVVSLGAALADFGKKVLLVDANFSAPNLGLHLNLIDAENNLNEVLNRKIDVSDAIKTYENFDVLPSSLYSNSQINPLKLKDYLKPLKKKYDVILIDSSPSLNEETLATMLASDELFVVTTPDFPTLSTTMKAVKLAKQRGTPVSGLILNKSYGKSFELSLDEIEETANIPVLAVIPYNVEFLKSLSNFSPFTSYSRSEGSVEFKKLAAAILGEKYNPWRLKDFLKFKPERQEINRELFYKRVF